MLSIVFLKYFDLLYVGKIMLISGELDMVDRVLWFVARGDDVLSCGFYSSGISLIPALCSAEFWLAEFYASCLLLCASLACRYSVAQEESRPISSSPLAVTDLF